MGPFPCKPFFFFVGFLSFHPGWSLRGGLSQFFEVVRVDYPVWVISVFVSSVGLLTRR